MTEHFERSLRRGVAIAACHAYRRWRVKAPRARSFWKEVVAGDIVEWYEAQWVLIRGPRWMW